MKDFFKELFAYNFHCNLALIHHVISNKDNVPEKSIQLINHILNAQQIWNARILNSYAECSVWELRPMNNLIEINEINQNVSLKILDEINIEDELNYKNSKGITFENKVKDVLFHIINHSTYHRAQISSNLKSVEITPLNSDYIFYKRN